MDAVLSVRTSAGMLGALRLGRLAKDVELCGRLTSEQLRHELNSAGVKHPF